MAWFVGVWAIGILFMLFLFGLPTYILFKAI